MNSYGIKKLLHCHPMYNRSFVIEKFSLRLHRPRCWCCYLFRVQLS